MWVLNLESSIRRLLITRYLANGSENPNFYSRLSNKDRAGPKSAHRLRAWPETLGKPARLSVWQATKSWFLTSPQT